MAKPQNRISLYRRYPNFKFFRADVRRELIWRDWTYRDLARYTGYTSNYISNLMCGRGSAAAVRRILKVLELNERDYR